MRFTHPHLIGLASAPEVAQQIVTTYGTELHSIQLSFYWWYIIRFCNFKGRNWDNGSKMVCKRIRKVQKMAPIYSPLSQLLMHGRINTEKICHHAFRRKPAISQLCLPKKKNRLSLHRWTECHSELAFRLLTDSRVQCAPASTQLAFSGRWTERWLRRQVQSYLVRWSQTFLWALFFSFATNSNLLLSSYSNKTIICSNKRWENGDGHLQDVWLLNNTVRNHIRCVNKAAGSSLLFRSYRKIHPWYFRGFYWQQKNLQLKPGTCFIETQIA